MSKEYFERYMNDVWLSRRTHVGPIPAKLPRLQGAPSSREFVKVWELPTLGGVGGSDIGTTVISGLSMRPSRRPSRPLESERK
jgi:hypothetical protein